MRKRAALRKAEDKAMGWMRRGGVLIRMNTKNGVRPFIVPGGEIPEEVFQLLLEREDIQPGGDSLFPGLDQTYKLRTKFAAPAAIKGPLTDGSGLKSVHENVTQNERNENGKSCRLLSLKLPARR